MQGLNTDEMDYFNSKHRQVSLDEEAELDEYFATYVPLSNLPTPPLSSTSSSIAGLGHPIATSEFTGTSLHQDQQDLFPEHTLINTQLQRSISHDWSHRTPQNTVHLLHSSQPI
jgi:hypothetical protein